VQILPAPPRKWASCTLVNELSGSSVHGICRRLASCIARDTRGAQTGCSDNVQTGSGNIAPLDRCHLQGCTTSSFNILLDSKTRSSLQSLAQRGQMHFKAVVLEAARAKFVLELLTTDDPLYAIEVRLACPRSGHSDVEHVP
jgi:hypothetical protein